MGLTAVGEDDNKCGSGNGKVVVFFIERNKFLLARGAEGEAWQEGMIPMRESVCVRGNIDSIAICILQRAICILH